MTETSAPLPALLGPTDADIAWLYTLPADSRAIAFTVDGTLAAIDLAAYNELERFGLVVVADRWSTNLLSCESGPTPLADLTRRLRKVLPELIAVRALAPYSGEWNAARHARAADDAERRGELYELASQHGSEFAESEMHRDLAGHNPDVILTDAEQTLVLDPAAAVARLVDDLDRPSRINTTHTDRGRTVEGLVYAWMLAHPSRERAS